ncbi:Lrp/AsnC family transcriptional regulator, partial [Bacteroidota bacterium]
LKKLEDRGVIEGYFAKINKKWFGFDIMAFINVVMDSSKNYPTLANKVQKTPEILECYSVLGEGSHILKTVVKDTEALEKLLGKIQSWPGVTRTVTSFVLSTIKETNKLKLRPKE